MIHHGILHFLWGKIVVRYYLTPCPTPYFAAGWCRIPVPALLGAALGYLLMAAPPAAWQYPLAALLAVGLRQLLAVITHKACPWQNVIGVLIGLTAAVILPGAYRHPLVYDVLLWMTSQPPQRRKQPAQQPPNRKAGDRKGKFPGGEAHYQPAAHPDECPGTTACTRRRNKQQHGGRHPPQRYPGSTDTAQAHQAQRRRYRQ